MPATPFAPSFFATAMLDHGTAQLGAQLQAVWYRAAIMAQLGIDVGPLQAARVVA